MTSNNVKVEIHRKKKKKILGEFKTVYDHHLVSECEINQGNNGTDFFKFPMKLDVNVKDRILTPDSIFDVKSINGTPEFTMATGKKNEFETNMRKLKSFGCSIQEGIVTSTGKDPEAEIFMDSWVGTYITNIVSHYDEIKSGKDISPFYGMFNHDVPVVSVGAGPSLDKNVHLLYEFPGIIISTDRAYKMLRARGIEPDIIISVDCHYDHIVEMLDCPGSEDHRLILNTCADPKIMKKWRGDIFWFLMRHPGVQFMDKILPALFPKFHSLPNLGNVGNTSVFFAEYMGLSPIVLVGHDYGYTGNKMHAQKFDIKENGKIKEVDTNHSEQLEKRSGKIKSGKVTTYAPFLSYRDTMYDLREKKGIDVINCTEGGILDKLPSMPLSKMIDILTQKHGSNFQEAKEKIRSV